MLGQTGGAYCAIYLATDPLTIDVVRGQIPVWLERRLRPSSRARVPDAGILAGKKPVLSFRDEWDGPSGPLDGAATQIAV